MVENPVPQTAAHQAGHAVDAICAFTQFEAVAMTIWEEGGFSRRGMAFETQP